MISTCPHAASGNAEGENCYETSHTLKLSLGPLNLVKKSINRSDINISKQVSPVLQFQCFCKICDHSNLRFPCQIELILRKKYAVFIRSGNI